LTTVQWRNLRLRSVALPPRSCTDKSKDVLLAAKDRRMRELEEENAQVRSELRSPLGDIMRNIEWLFPVRGRWLRYLLAPIGLCAALLLVPFLLFTAEVPIHNWNLERFSGSFAAIQHPPGSTRVKILKQVGNIQGTGNDCQYFVAELRTYTGSKQRIQDFYEGVTIKNPLNGQGQPIQIAFVEYGSFFDAWTLPWTYRDLEPWSLPKGIAGDHVYVVFVFEGANDLGLDYRCN